MERENFIFYRSFYEAIEVLSEEVQLEVFKAIAEYGLHGTVAEQLSSMARSILTLIKPQIDANNARYENGKKGGAPKGNGNNPHGRPKTNQWLDKNQPRTNQKLTKNKPRTNPKLTQNKPRTNQKPTKNQPKTNQKPTKNQPNVNVNENVNENVNDNNILTVINNSSSITKLTRQKAAFDFIEFFNSEMKKANAQIPQIKSLSGEREGFLNARIREFGLDAVKDVIQKAAASNFLNGGGPKGWLADCTWLLRPNNFPKILEGNYDNHQEQTNNYYDRRQQAKLSTLARQNAAIDRVIEEETRRWKDKHLADGEGVEDVFAYATFPKRFPFE